MCLLHKIEPRNCLFKECHEENFILELALSCSFLLFNAKLQVSLTVLPSFVVEVERHASQTGGRNCLCVELLP